MSAWRILGADGQPMVVSNGEGKVERRPSAALARVPEAIRPDGIIDPAFIEKVDREWASEIQKQVRSRSVSLLALQDRERGKPKPTPVTFTTLRLMANRNEWVGAIIGKRKRQIAGVSWDVTLKDGDDPSGAAKKAARAIKKLLQRPQMHGSQPDSITWRDFISMWLEDLLVLDRASIEKERDGNGWIVALYNVDGATIQPNMTSRGALADDAYKQIIDGVVTASFGVEDLIVSIDNPQTDVRFKGYGYSPLERAVVSITADLHAAKFNAEYFQKGAVPEGVLHLGEEIDPDSVDAFRIYWLNEIQGRPNALPIIGGSKAPDFIQWRQPNRDMQFMEYQQWLLQKLCAGFQMDPSELGQIEDVNRSTAEETSSQDDRGGIQPLLARIKDTIDLEVIGEYGQGLGDYLEFTWEQQGESAEEINAKFQPMVNEGAATMAEWRDAHGLDPDGDPKATHGKEGLRMHLSGGQQQPLPNAADANALGAAAQQQREDEQNQQQMENDSAARQAQGAGDSAGGGGEASPTPWKPADPDHPDVQAAMAAHDEEHGIGPRNVGKSSSGIVDRHPALSSREEDLSGVLDAAAARLIDGLAQILTSTTNG